MPNLADWQLPITLEWYQSVAPERPVEVNGSVLTARDLTAAVNQINHYPTGGQWVAIPEPQPITFLMDDTIPPQTTFKIRYEYRMPVFQSYYNTTGATSGTPYNQVYTLTTTTGNLTNYFLTGNINYQYVTPEEQAKRALEVKREATRKLRAANKAKKLLFECLDESQIIDFKTRQAFTVRSQSGKLFELREGRSRNIKLLGPDGKPVKTYCIHPTEQVPNGDTLLAQKFWLETNEEEFLKVAYVS